MQNIYRLLKPGGIAFHEYNPFFALNGGHSACTLDFLWGHVLLSNEDIKEYIRLFRPEEYDTAIDFYQRALNRMSLADLKSAVLKAGFNIVALVPWVRESHLELLTPGALKLAISRYPNLTIMDLICPVVWIVTEKPMSLG